jgi:hypothetical protein
MRYTGLSLYCRPSYLSDLLGRNGIPETPLLHTIADNPGRRGVARAAAALRWAPLRGHQFAAKSISARLSPDAFGSQGARAAVRGTEPGIGFLPSEARSRPGPR